MSKVPTSVKVALAAGAPRSDLACMTMADPRPKTIDMTLEGKVLAPPSFWSRMRAIWHALPPGAIPAILIAATAAIALAVFFLGLLVLALPVMLALALLALVARALAR